MFAARAARGFAFGRREDVALTGWDPLLGAWFDEVEPRPRFVVADLEAWYERELTELLWRSVVAELFERAERWTLRGEGTGSPVGILAPPLPPLPAPVPPDMVAGFAARADGGPEVLASLARGAVARFRFDSDHTSRVGSVNRREWKGRR